MNKIKNFAAFLSLVLASAALVTHAQSQSNGHTSEPALISTQTVGLAIDGYDAVAYFDQNQAVEGDLDYTCEYNNVTWRFSSAENRDRFMEDPEKFSPQYGGYCAHSLSNNKLIKSDPEFFRYVTTSYTYTPMNHSPRETSREVVFPLRKGKPKEIKIG